ncbi:OsmC family protein [Carboxylicivirga sp. N1Y90]|uniref:OsmC family protein n=1 Tax=Carboxylicivirga fragile TaxID=3417571 RepID=UPI003D335D7A|nr:OsmC family protein [Marinilabiliaceae bacterium N1Y90]
MKSSVNLKWTGNMSFETELFGHKLVLDAGTDNGGEDKGPRPKILMLTALAGCTGMDVTSILKKMRVKIDDLQIIVEGDMTEEHPKYYKSMKVIYQFKGENLPMEKLEKAVSLSEERYCGVSALYKKAIPVTTEIQIV